MRALLFAALMASPVLAVEPPTYSGPPVYSGPPAYQAAKVEASPRYASVYVSVDLGNGASAGGTGTVIGSESGRSLILTAAHVVESAERPIKVTYWFEGQPWIQPATYLGGSTVLHTSPNFIEVQGPDLALLSVACTLPSVPLASEIPAQGSPVSFYGFGGAGIEGTVPLLKAGVYAGDSGGLGCRTTIQTVNGDSGAGILNARGEVVAVHWGAGATRLDTIHAFTVRTLRTRRVLFPRLHDRLAARKIVRAIAPVLPAFGAGQACPGAACPLPQATPPSVPFTVSPDGCAGGSCPAPSGRGRWFRRWR